MPSTPLSSAKLTSLTSQTLKLLLDRQSGRVVDDERVRRNLQTLSRNRGAMEKGQWERVKGMAGELADDVEDEGEVEAPADPVHEPYHDTTPVRYTDADDPRNDMDDGQLVQEQQRLMDQQDSHLDILAASISRQHLLANDIGGELESQVGLIESLEEEVDNTHNRLGRARQKLDRVARGVGGNLSTMVIGLLILILLVLIVIFKT